MDETDHTEPGVGEPGEGRRPCPWCGRPVEPGRAACRACGFDFEHMAVEEEPREEEDEGGEAEAPAAPHPLEVACFECGEVNHRDADFCRKCGAAIGKYSWTIRGWLWALVILIVLVVIYLFCVG